MRAWHLTILFVLVGCGDEIAAIVEEPAPGGGTQIRQERVGGEETAAEEPPALRVEGRELCLQLWANGDFELFVTPADHPKVVVIGRAERVAHAEGEALRLTPSRIVRPRWVGRCRKTVARAIDLVEFDFLNRAFQPGQSVSLTLRRRADAYSLCGSADTCVEELARVSSRVAGTYQRRFDPSAEYELTKVEYRPGRAGLDAAGAPHPSMILLSGVTRTGTPATGARVFVPLSGHLVDLGGDRFVFRGTPTKAVTIMGTALRGEVDVRLRRVANHGLEVCFERCETLPRHFSVSGSGTIDDAYNTSPRPAPPPPSAAARVR